MRMRLLVILGIVCVVAACSGATTDPGGGTTGAATATATAGSADASCSFDDEEALTAAARDEGAVVFATSGDEEGFAAAFEPFTEEYGIEVEIFRQAGEEITERILSEAAAGRNSVDILHAPAETVLALRSEGLITTLPALPSAEPYPDGAYFEDWGIAMRQIKYAMAYNTENVTEEDLASLENGLGGMLDREAERWVGRVGMEFPERGAGGGFNLLYTSYDTGRMTNTHLERLASLDPIYDRSATPLTNRLAAGDFDLYINGEIPYIAELASSGAPIDWIMQDELFVLPVPGAIVSGAPNPNAACLALDYIVGQEAQQLLLDNGEPVAHPEVPDPTLPDGYEPNLLISAAVAPDDAEEFTELLIETFDR